jgi:hypothetical protein
MTGPALALALILPAALAAAMALPSLRGVIWRLVPLAALPALALALLAGPGQSFALRADWLILGVELGLDPVSRLFLAFTAVLWIAAGTASSPATRSASTPSSR